MTALERIQEIDNRILRVYSAPMLSPELQTNLLEFLIKSFRVMREIAMKHRGIAAREIHGSKQYVLCDPANVDKEFEERMLRDHPRQQ